MYLLHCLLLVTCFIPTHSRIFDRRLCGDGSLWVAEAIISLLSCRPGPEREKPASYWQVPESLKTSLVILLAVNPIVASSTRHQNRSVAHAVSMYMLI